MKNLRINIDEPRDAQKYITRAEHDFRNKLDGAIEEVFEDGTPRVVALAGPTCSGKTTTANKLTRKINDSGYRAVTFSIDDFFLDRADRNVVEGESPDYDSVDAIDLDYLEDCINGILKGKKVRIPHFDFENTRRDGYTEFIPDKKDIYVFEGIQAVYPEVTRLFGKEYKSIFICVADDVKYRGAVLEKNEIRLLRRIIRDWNFRNATPEFTLHLWQSVRANEEKSIFPNSGNCDIYIDSFLRYEPFIAARHAFPLLSTVPTGSKYKAYANELTEKLKPFKCEFFKEEMIPERSMFREFIG